MKVLKWMVIVVAALAATVVGVAFVLPDQGHLERTVVIDRPPATLFVLLDGFRRFNEWSPWAALDPKTIYTQEGPPLGVGAKFSWASDDPKVGAGSQEILDTVPNERIRIRLIYSDFDTDNTATYVLVPEGTGTKLTWSYDSRFKGNLMGRWFGVMLESMIGPDYDKGLVRLKALAETLPNTDVAGLEVKVVDQKALSIVSVPGHTTTDVADIGKALGEAYGKIGKAMTAAALQQDGQPLAITRKWDPRAKTFDFDAGIPVTPPEATLPEGEVKMARTQEGQTLEAKHVGAYAKLPQTYEKLAAWQQAAGFEPAGDAWEQYVSDPVKTPESEVVTMVNVPVK